MSKYLLIQVKQREGIMWFQSCLLAKNLKTVFNLPVIFMAILSFKSSMKTYLCEMLTRVMSECGSLLMG